MVRRAKTFLTATASAVVSLTLLTSGIAGAAPATDDPGTGSTTTADDALPRLERACHRIPNIELRTTNLLTRLGGDVTTKGSLLWLEARVAEASDAGRDQLATVLENRLEVRRSTVGVLEARQDALVEARELCTEHGIEP